VFEVGDWKLEKDPAASKHSSNIVRQGGRSVKKSGGKVQRDGPAKL